jgi:uncharacterized membrane protein YkoI
MNLTKLRSKRVLLPTVAAVVALGVGGVVWTSAANADVQGSERDRVASAATKAVGGTALDVETSDERGVAYEVEVRQDDGTEVDVSLDKNLAMISQDVEGRETNDEDGDGEARSSGSESGDRALSPAERTAAERVAVNAVGGGTVTEVDASDDPGEAYDVDVRAPDGTEWDVELDSDFKVLHKTADD